MSPATITLVTVTLRRAWSDSDKYAIDMRLGSRGKQLSAKVRQYESAKEPMDLEDLSRDIHENFGAQVKLSGGHYE